MGAAITGWGMAVPETTLDNAELARRVDVSETWIVERTGIRSRRIAALGETTSSLATGAGRAALIEAGVEPEELDLVVVATATPDQQLPAVAPLVQNALGAAGAAAFDIGAGCSGFLYALATAQAFTDSGMMKKVLVIGADTLSRITDYGDARTCVLFGDGAGAVVVEHGPEAGLGPFHLHSDGSAPELLQVPPGERFLEMNGREVYKRAVEEMSSSIEQALASAALSLEDVDLVVAHQANARIVDAVAARVGLDPARAFCNIDRYGNTSAASIPIALVEASRQGVLRAGHTLILTAFGAGFVWGAGVVHWGTAGRLSAADRDRETAGV